MTEMTKTSINGDDNGEMMMVKRGFHRLSEGNGIEWMNPRPEGAGGPWGCELMMVNCGWRLKSCWRLRNFAQHCGKCWKKICFLSKLSKNIKWWGEFRIAPVHLKREELRRSSERVAPLHPQRQEVESSRPFLFHPMNRRGLMQQPWDVVTGPKADAPRWQEACTTIQWSQLADVLWSGGHFLLGVCDVFWETDKIHMIPYIICIKRLNVDHWGSVLGVRVGYNEIFLQSFLWCLFKVFWKSRGGLLGAS